MNKKKCDSSVYWQATMTAGMLAGCGGSSGSSDSSSSSSGGKDKLTFWFPTFASADGEVTDEEFWNEKMDAFEKENNCEVNVEIIPWDNYEEKLSDRCKFQRRTGCRISVHGKCSMTISIWVPWQTSMNTLQMMKKGKLPVLRSGKYPGWTVCTACSCW